MELRRIFPDGAVLTAAQAITGLRLGDRAAEGRPYVVANMITSADGKASFHGRSGKLGGDADRAVFHRLRTQADAVLVGTGTLRAERYGRLVREPELRAAREAEGLAPDPLACVVSRSGNLPLDIPLFREADQPVVCVTSADIALESGTEHVAVERVPVEELTMARALRVLRESHGVRSVLCEGGPTVLGTLLAERCVDELFLSLAPKLAGGAEAPTAVEGAPLPDLVDLELEWALEAGGALFLRYRVVNP